MRIRLYEVFMKKQAVVFLSCCMMAVVPGFAQESSREKIEKLEKQVRELSETVRKLESQLSESKKIAPKDSVAEETVEDVDEALLKELEAELSSKAQEQNIQQQPQISGQTLAARQRMFQGMNPNISVIGNFTGSGTSLTGVERNYDFGLDESEFAFIAAVDPYARADFYVAFGKHADEGLIPEGEEGDNNGHGGEGEEGGGLEAELEEAYLTLLSLPYSMQLKAGRFRPKFGKINETHPHAYHYIGVPLMYQNYLGGEGLVDEGASLTWLLPNRKFFQELTLSILSGPAESPSFTRAEADNFLYLAHLKSFFDLSDNTSLEIGLAGTAGPHNAHGDRTTIYSTDVTLKWKPLQFNRYKSFEWQTEALLSRRDAPDGTIESFALFSHLRYQIARRWFLGYLFDYSEFPQTNKFHHTAVSGILQFFATEFQKFEIHTRFNAGNFFDDYLDVSLRAVFVIGSHGAHQY
ncbi:MAG: hypothetical protein V3U73_15355 [bacterium]